jgi:uracil phosphoribosyltransferase
MSKTKDQVDCAYLELPRELEEIEHAYGSRVHILSDPFLLTHLAFLCEEKTKQPTVNEIVRDLYQYLIKAVLNAEFPRIVAHVETRMSKFSSRGIWTGQIIEQKVPTVTVNVMRAGTLPSQVCFDYLNKTIDPRYVRQDHIVMSRVVDEEGKVKGTYLGDSKIGGSVDNAFVIFPDPMGATGGSLCDAIHHYKKNVPGKARRYLTVNLIVTPEYLRRMKVEHPDVVVYALRLDRGASSAEILKKKPGVRWNEESGLTDKDYIVPGAGGLGEIMNNTLC